MANLKYAKNIVYDTKPYSPEEMEKIKESQKKKDLKSTIKLTRLLWMDSDMVKGASIYMECVWLWEGSTTRGTTEEPHVHEFDEVIGFVSTKRENPRELDAEMEIWLGDEKNILKNSCLVYIPRGMKHCPLTFRQVNRPVFFFTLAPKGMYGRISEGAKSPAGGKPEKPVFLPPEKDANGSRYARYIVTEVPPRPVDPKAPRPTMEGTRLLRLEDKVIPGAFYADFVWIWKGSGTIAPGGHSHNWDEMFGLIGADREHERDLGGTVELTLGDEKHVLKNSCLVYVPRGLHHCPLEFKNIQKPTLCFTVGNTTEYTSIQKNKTA